MVLDRAISFDGELFARLEEVLHGKVHSATVQELDLVNDKTIVDVRYAYLPAGTPRSFGPRAEGIAQTGSEAYGELPRHELAPATAGAA